MSTTGEAQWRYSSIKPFRVRAADRFALPKMNRSLPDCFFSLATSSSAFPLTSLELFHSAFSIVLEKTILGTLFMKSAISPFSFDQNDAIPWYVTRPNKSAPIDFDCSTENRSSSSPQTESCQSMSQLFRPSKKPSSVTRFHMISFLTRITRPASVHRASLLDVAVRPAGPPVTPRGEGRDWGLPRSFGGRPRGGGGRGRAPAGPGGAAARGRSERASLALAARSPG